MRGEPPRALPSPRSRLLPPPPLSPPLTHPRPAMPDQISVSEFVSETNEDYKSPTASNFTTRMAQCRNTVAAIEEVSPGRGGAAGRGAGCVARSGLAARRGGSSSSSREQGATGADSCRSLAPPGPEERPPLPLKGNGARPGGEGKEKERGEGLRHCCPPARGARAPPASPL